VEYNFITFYYQVLLSIDRIIVHYHAPVMAGEKKCKGYIKKLTFNETEETCVTYINGGCNGTRNLFETEGECQSSCHQMARRLQDHL
jgi:hypothetical protein